MCLRVPCASLETPARASAFVASLKQPGKGALELGSVAPSSAAFVGERLLASGPGAQVGGRSPPSGLVGVDRKELAALLRAGRFGCSLTSLPFLGQGPAFRSGVALWPASLAQGLCFC